MCSSISFDRRNCFPSNGESRFLFPESRVLSFFLSYLSLGDFFSTKTPACLRLQSEDPREAGEQPAERIGTVNSSLNLRSFYGRSCFREIERQRERESFVAHDPIRRTKEIDITTRVRQGSLIFDARRISPRIVIAQRRI